MLFLLVTLLLAVDPFWVAKSPGEWTNAELSQFLTDSPWAQYAQGPKGAQPVLVFVATAGPMLRAEEEREQRGKQRRRELKQPEPQEDELGAEYRLWLDDNRPSQLIVSIFIPNLKGFSDEKEVRHMEEDTYMRLGRKKIKITGHFPPTPRDPYLRLAFPRSGIRLEDKNVGFDFYLPGIPIPFRHAEFLLKDMVSNGRLEL